MEAPTIQNIREYVSPNSTNFQLVNTVTPITGGSRSFSFTSDYYHYPKKEFTKGSSIQSPKFKLLQEKIDNELRDYAQYISIDIEEAKVCMYDLAKQLSDIQFEDAAIEITPNNAVKFKMVLDNTRLLIINKPLEELMDLESGEVIFSIFVNRELILSNVGTTSNVVQAIQKYMSM